MPWARFDERFPGHRRIRRLSDAAFRLHVSAICYSSEYLTDGHIAADDLEDVAEIRKPQLAVAELVKSGRWHPPGHDCAGDYCRPIDDGWLIHDYLEYNPAKADVEATRAWDRSRQSLYRDKPLVEAIKRRDRDRCRYCGQLVNWTDRRSPLGGQLDHVVPRGPNTLENVVVACRGCNTRKSGRTPDEAGMPLLGAGELGPSDIPKRKPRSSPSPESSDDFVPSRTVPTRPEPITSEVVPTSQPTAQTLLGEWIEHCDPTPPTRVKGQIAKLVGEMLAEGQPYEVVRRGLAAWNEKDTHPSTLPSFVFNASKPLANKATVRTAQNLALVQRLQEQERGA